MRFVSTDFGNTELTQDTTMLALAVNRLAASYLRFVERYCV